MGGVALVTDGDLSSIHQRLNVFGSDGYAMGIYFNTFR